ncbi:STAS domain-containing protein [Streptomyces sp. SBT349]|uniref:STAS domain-containing protein n=1 Tax=Streptomyces sp. SBT349 TaxID=1580539 RepID=UPI00131CB8AD
MCSQLFVIRGPVVRGDVPGICDRLAAFVRGSGASEVTVDVGAVGGGDAVALEVVARMRLTAKRLGCRIRFVNMRSGLQGLLGWLGLGEVGGQTEEREEPRRVQERVEPGDAAL